MGTSFLSIEGTFGSPEPPDGGAGAAVCLAAAGPALDPTGFDRGIIELRIFVSAFSLRVVSENSIRDIHADMGVTYDRMRLVPVGVDPDLFRPRPEIARIPGRLITTASADVALKGLSYLLEATAKLRKVVDVEDAETGTVRLKKAVEKADEMALDTASTKTTRIKR